MMRISEEAMRRTRAMTRPQYEQVKDLLPLGGDLWNRANIFRRAFARPEVNDVAIDYIGTGLWVTVDTNIGRITVYD